MDDVSKKILMSYHSGNYVRNLTALSELAMAEFGCCETKKGS
jgi:hypothetical protein